LVYEGWASIRGELRPEQDMVSLEIKPPGRSAELKGPRKGICDFEQDLGQKLGQTKPKISGTAPTNRDTTIPNVSGPTSSCFDDDPKLFNCEIAQPSQLKPAQHPLKNDSPLLHLLKTGPAASCPGQF
jgi:hypothetical protein